MATSIRYNLTADGDKVLSISGSQIARQINIGNSWRWLRLGVRFQLTNSRAVVGVDNIVGPTLAIGLSSGTSSLYGDTNTTHFMGIDTDSSKTFIGTYIGVRSYNISNGQRIVTKVNNTITTHYSNSNYYVGMPREDQATPANQHRTVNYIDYIKPAVDPGVGTIIFYRDVNGGAGADIASASFYSIMVENTASIVGSNSSSAYNMPMSESVYGYLDTVNINWGNVYGLEISDVAVYRFD